jgi:teichuronic acid biosynthesis protein TuaE
MPGKDSAASDRAHAGVVDILLRDHPFRYGLLMAPALILFFYQVGRGLGSTGYVLYWIAAVAVLVRQRDFVFPTAAMVAYAVLVAWGSLSAALSVDPHSAYGKWAQYALLSSSYFITWWLVRRIPEFSLERAIKMVGMVGLLSFAYYAGRYLILSGSPDFKPQFQVHGLLPAYLSPFSLYFLWQSVPGKRGMVLSLAYLLSLSLLLIFSNSLTEVLTLATALVVLAFFMVRGKRMLVLSLGSVALVFGVLIMLFDPLGRVLHRALHADGNWFAVFSKLSSHRADIWYKALKIPPPNQWLGVGPGNVYLYPPVVIDEIRKVGHLHNLFLDCWYEIGVIGLAAYLLFYGIQIRLMKQGGGDLTFRQRGIMYASVAGVLVASLLEQSYRSAHAVLFVPFLFALYSLGKSGPALKMRTDSSIQNAARGRRSRQSPKEGTGAIRVSVRIGKPSIDSLMALRLLRVVLAMHETVCRSMNNFARKTGTCRIVPVSNQPGAQPAGWQLSCGVARSSLS